MRGPRLEAALQGDLRRYLEEELDLAKRAVTKGVHKQSTVLKHALRADVIAGGLGRKLARSWQQENYPKGNVSLNAASYVFSKAEKLGFSCATSLTDGLRATANWYIDNVASLRVVTNSTY